MILIGENQSALRNIIRTTIQVLKYHQIPYFGIGIEIPRNMNVKYILFLQLNKCRRLTLQFFLSFAFCWRIKICFAKVRVYFQKNHFSLTPQYWQVIKYDCKMIAFFHLSESCFWRTRSKHFRKCFVYVIFKTTKKCH